MALALMHIQHNDTHYDDSDIQHNGTQYVDSQEPYSQHLILFVTHGWAH